MRFLRSLSKHSVALKCAARPGAEYTIDVHGVVSRENATQLLGLLLAQAAMDGMRRIALRCDSQSHTVTLQYSRSLEDDPATTWEMTAPPPEAFMPLFQAAVARASFTKGCVPEGDFVALLNQRRYTVRVRIVSAAHFELACVEYRP